MMSASSRSLWLLALLLGGCGDEGSPVVDGGQESGLTDARSGDSLPGEALPGEARPGDYGRGDGPQPSACSAGPALLAKVSSTRMLADLQQLTSSERTSAAGQAKAATYLQQQLAPLGLQAKALTYTRNGATYSNIEATLPGALPSRYVFIGAHYDAASSSPGADDDASGTVAVLEMARALSGCKLNRTVRFLFFSDEEAGTVGSSQYVQSIKASIPAADLLGFLSLDMIGWARSGVVEDIDLATRPAYGTLVNDMAASMTKWGSVPVKKVINDQCG
jgi:hypothetical protein